MKPRQILSREEISELRSALGSCDKAASAVGRVQPYDFQGHGKLSKQGRKALEQALDDLALLWTGTGIAVFKSESSVISEPPEEMACEEFANSSGEAELRYRVRLPSVTESCVLEMPGSFGHRVLDRMSGGDGSGPTPSRRLTNVERNVVDCFVRRLLGDLSDAWRDILSAPAEICANVRSRADMALQSHETVAVASMLWELHGVAERVRIAIPVDAWTSRFGEPGRVRNPGKGQAPEVRENVLRLVESVNLIAAVELGRATVSVQDLLNMDIGDVLVLDGTVRDPLQMMVGENVTFTARPGRVGNRISVRITRDSKQRKPSRAAADAGEIEKPEEQSNE